MPIVRDRYKIIIQHDFKDPSNEAAYDGGDSICRTGIMALCDSNIDKTTLETDYWTPSGEFVRHPYDKDPRWRNYKESSRDQLVCAIAGMNKYQAKKVLHRHRWMRINKDFLAPDVMLHMTLCAEEKSLLWSVLGYPWLVLSIMWSCYVTPKHELNQIICQCLKAGKFFLRLLCDHHPDWKRNIEAYWGVRQTDHGYWRDQQEIAYAIIKKVEGVLK